MELLRKAQEAKDLSDKALKQTEIARKKATLEADSARNARLQARQEESERHNAQQKAQLAESRVKDTRMIYKRLFIGNSIFTLVLALLMAYSKRSVFLEVLNWFPDRLKNLKSIALFFKDFYMGVVTLVIQNMKLSAVWGYVTASLVSLALLMGLFFLCRWLLEEIGYKIQAIQEEYTDRTFKEIISADIAISLFFICLWFYEPIKNILHLNIFSVWLLLSIIGCIAWNGREIVGGIQRGY